MGGQSGRGWRSGGGHITRVLEGHAQGLRLNSWGHRGHRRAWKVLPAMRRLGWWGGGGIAEQTVQSQGQGHGGRKGPVLSRSGPLKARGAQPSSMQVGRGLAEPRLVREAGLGQGRLEEPVRAGSWWEGAGGRSTPERNGRGRPLGSAWRAPRPRPSCESAPKTIYVPSGSRPAAPLPASWEESFAPPLCPLHPLSPDNRLLPPVAALLLAPMKL